MHAQYPQHTPQHKLLSGRKNAERVYMRFGFLTFFFTGTKESFVSFAASIAASSARI